MNFKLLFLFLSVACCTQAQQLLLQGKVYFERQENMHKQLDEESSSEWARSAKKRMPKYRKDVFVLHFNTQQSLYKLFKEEENKEANNGWWRVAWDNQVWFDFVNDKYIQEKNIYEKQYVIADSLPHYTWKMEGEYREVAGFTCRKASTVIMDSLFVIAFFTEQIPVSSGPETFCGLPGMILGLVIPKVNYTYFATKVESAVVKEPELQLTTNKKAEKMSKKDILKEVSEAMADWGKYGRKIYWKSVF